MVLMRKLPNRWECGDERFGRLLDIANAIIDNFELAHGNAQVVYESEMNPGLYHFWTPTRTAKEMLEVGNRILRLTDV